MSLFRKNQGETEHTYTEERLCAYLDNQLSSQERNVVERHLNACPQCRWHLETLQQTVRWVNELPTVPLPCSFTIPVPVRQARPAREVRRAWAMPLLQGATAVVALLFFVAVVGDALLGRTLLAPGAEPEAVAVEKAAEGPTVVAVFEVQATPAPEVAAPAEEPLPRMAQEAEVVVEVTVVVEVAGASAETEQLAVASVLSATETSAVGVGSEEGAGATMQAMAEPTGAAPPPEPPSGMGPGLNAEPAAKASVEATTVTDTGQRALVTATAAPTVEVVPTEMAAVTGQPDQVASLAEEKDGRGGSTATRSWPGRAVIPLGVAFVVLGVLTIILMVRRLRLS